MDEVEAASMTEQVPPEESPAEEFDDAPESTAPEKPEESLALAAAQYRSSAAPLKQRIRILGVPLPIGGVSWATSILIHAVLIWTGVTLYKHFIQPPKLELALGDGGANPVGIMWREQAPGGAEMPQVPETDATRPPMESIASVVTELESRQESDPKMSEIASTYVGPKLLWGAPPPIGAGHGTSDFVGTPAAHRGSRNAPASKSPPAQAGEGAGHGKSVGDGSGQSTGGQAGVPNGMPDLKLPAPIYPVESIRRKEQGVVKLSVSVLSDGSVGDITVVSAPPYSRLTESAIDAVRHVHVDRAYAGAVLNVPYVFTLP